LTTYPSGGKTGYRFYNRIKANAYLMDTFSESEETMISLETEKNCTTFKVTGEVTADEILHQLAQYMRGEPTDTAIWDFTEAQNVKISTLEMKGIADSIRTFSNDDVSRRIAFAGSKNINIGLGKVFAAFAEMAGVTHEYKVFRDADTARQWLRDRPENN
jgi:hypothetical protein